MQGNEYNSPYYNINFYIDDNLSDDYHILNHNTCKTMNICLTDTDGVVTIVQADVVYDMTQNMFRVYNVPSNDGEYASAILYFDIMFVHHAVG